MRALTLWEPWATAILAGYKHYETRSWATTYRGTIAIHAGLKCDAGQLLWARSKYPPFPAISTGQIIAIAELDDCQEMATAPPGDEIDWGEYGPGRYGWKLLNIRPVETVAIRGYQGLWRLPPSVAESLTPIPK